MLRKQSNQLGYKNLVGVSLDPNRIHRGKSFRSPTPKTELLTENRSRNRNQSGLMISRKEKTVLPTKMKRPDAENLRQQRIPEVSVNLPSKAD